MDTTARRNTAAFWTATEYFEQRIGLDRNTILIGDEPADAPSTLAWTVRFAGSGELMARLKIDHRGQERSLREIAKRRHGA